MHNRASPADPPRVPRNQALPGSSCQPQALACQLLRLANSGAGGSQSSEAWAQGRHACCLTSVPGRDAGRYTRCDSRFYGGELLARGDNGSGLATPVFYHVRPRARDLGNLLSCPAGSFLGMLDLVRMRLGERGRISELTLRMWWITGERLRRGDQEDAI